MKEFNKQIESYFESAKKVEEAIEALQYICAKIDAKLDNFIYLMGKGEF